MKLIILVALALVAVTIAAPVEEKRVVEIVEYKSQQEPDGSYSFYYKTSDGSIRQETGVVREARDEENNLKKVVIVNGSYTVVDAEGNSDTVTYSADEAGYHAEGPSIPKVVA
ncbi:hypothetical protein PYW08_014781 [Mythimna loreyi]|uniref:Uncharacterized protein n=1 Tax=Mythimna loreyi TaxID=667449 RepID=A0ACC2R3G3_9NEOP|nr:hypothetical protein PYW08_014781 [Mythimna loreyi]